MKAVVFVDVQNDFVKNGKLAFGYPVEDNLPKVIEFAKECVADRNYKIYATRDTHEQTMYYGPKSYPISGYLTSLEGQKLPVEHCVEGEFGWQIVDPLMEVLLGNCTFVNKPTFGSRDLIEIIYEDTKNVNRDRFTDFAEIILCGYDLSICVLANAVLLRATFPNKKITVKTSLCGDVDQATFEAAKKVLQMQQIEVED